MRLRGGSLRKSTEKIVKSFGKVWKKINWIMEISMAKKPIKETINAKGFKIGIYTSDFENEFFSLTDIARYKSDDPNATM